MTGRIMVVDDDVALAEMIGIVLTGEGYQPDYCTDGNQALTLIRQTRPDLVLLDLMLPGMDGIEVCRELRKESGVPVIMVTAKSDTKDIVEGLEVGADDYILKPFKPAELVARVRARLRRSPADDQAEGERLRIGDIEIDVPGHEVRKAGRLISLTPLEFDILETLASKPRLVFTREMLLERVWGYKSAADTRLVNVHVQRLRAKVETDPESPSVVLTVRGVGYKAGSPR
ncbi:MAG: response regulator transcription factor [Bifidobacteriaceae bacterium]|jgi:two-component system response regulator MtrA|nr:response regulator transcription factor [Bifidobacteriaceae bacterium]